MPTITSKKRSLSRKKNRILRWRNRQIWNLSPTLTMVEVTIEVKVQLGI